MTKSFNDLKQCVENLGENAGEGRCVFALVKEGSKKEDESIMCVFYGRQNDIVKSLAKVAVSDYRIMESMSLAVEIAHEHNHAIRNGLRVETVREEEYHCEAKEAQE